MSWLNQVETFFNSSTREVMTGGMWNSWKRLVEQIMCHIRCCSEQAAPFRLELHGQAADGVMPLCNGLQARRTSSAFQRCAGSPRSRLAADKRLIAAASCAALAKRGEPHPRSARQLRAAAALCSRPGRSQAQVTRGMPHLTPLRGGCEGALADME